MGTVIVSLIVVGMVVLAIRSIYRNKKSGKGCGCGCGGCANAGICHVQKEE